MSPIFLCYSLWTLLICIVLIMGYAFYEKFYLRKRPVSPGSVPREWDLLSILALLLYALYRAGSHIKDWLWRLKQARLKANVICPVCGHHNFHSPVCIHRRDEGWIEQELFDENSYQ
jgi:hypothetical protein